MRADEVPTKPKLLPLVHKYDLSTLAIHRKRARPLRTWRCGRLGRASGSIRRCLFYQKKSAAGSQAENNWYCSQCVCLRLRNPAGFMTVCCEFPRFCFNMRAQGHAVSCLAKSIDKNCRTSFKAAANLHYLLFMS